MFISFLFINTTTKKGVLNNEKKKTFKKFSNYDLQKLDHLT